MAKHTKDPQQTETPEVEAFNWEPHLRWIAPLTAVILLGTTGIIWFRGKSDSVRFEVIQAYNLADTADELQTIAEAYPDEPEAALARLQAGALLYNDGQFEKAKAQYELFLVTHPKHLMADNASWGVWMCMEALGDLDGALEGFKSVTEEATLYPQALLGRARILEKQGQPDQARTLYDTLRADFPDSGWAEQARVFTERLRTAAE